MVLLLRLFCYGCGFIVVVLLLLCCGGVVVVVAVTVVVMKMRRGKNNTKGRHSHQPLKQTTDNPSNTNRRGQPNPFRARLLPGNFVHPNRRVVFWCS